MLISLWFESRHFVLWSRHKINANLLTAFPETNPNKDTALLIYLYIGST